MRMSTPNVRKSSVSGRTPEELKIDLTPLTFGKYKGKTPERIADVDSQYIVWAYDTIKNRTVCSRPLAESCGYRDASRPIPQSFKGDEPLFDKSTRGTGFIIPDDLDEDVHF